MGLQKSRIVVAKASATREDALVMDKVKNETKYATNAGKVVERGRATHRAVAAAGSSSGTRQDRRPESDQRKLNRLCCSYLRFARKQGLGADVQLSFQSYLKSPKVAFFFIPYMCGHSPCTIRKQCKNQRDKNISHHGGGRPDRCWNSSGAEHLKTSCSSGRVGNGEEAMEIVPPGKVASPLWTEW